MGPDGKRTDDRGGRHSLGFTDDEEDEDEDFDLDNIIDWGFDRDPEDD
jgi:hypothetical protein